MRTTKVIPLRTKVIPITTIRPKNNLVRKIARNRTIRRRPCHFTPTMMWALSFAVSSSLCVWQVAICTHKFLDEPIGTDVVIESFSTYQLPALTICPATFNFGFDFEPIFQRKCQSDEKCKSLSVNEKRDYEFEKLNTSLRGLWNVWTNDFNVGVLCKYAMNESECLENKWLSVTEVDTVAGQCRVVYSDLYWHFTGKTWVWWLDIPNSTVVQSKQTISYMLDLHVAKLIKKEFIARVYIDDFDTNEVEVSVTEFKYLDTKRNPCVRDDEEIHCLNNCTNLNFLKSKSDCKLPFVDSHLPDCKSLSQVEKVQKIIFKLHYSDIACDCKRSCNTTKFSLTRVIGKYRIGGGTGIAVAFTSNTRQVVSEFVLYPFSSLVSELGGNIGLFLGISLLSTLTRLDLFVQQFYKITHKM